MAHGQALGLIDTARMRSVFLKVRLLLVASIMMAVGLVFVNLYARMLGDSPLHLWHHMVVLLPLVLLCYSLVGWLGRTRRRGLRRLLAWMVCMICVFLQLGFYLLCLACLYGFRDLPTWHVVSGYFDQIIPMVAALPVSQGLLGSAVAAVLLLFVVYGSVLAWLLRPVLEPATAHYAITRAAWLRLGTLSIITLVLLLWDPWEGLVQAREPVATSLHDRPLSSNTMIHQLNPVEAATDRGVEDDYPRQPLGNRRHVILIYVDALRADVLQPYGGVGEMPFLTQLVRDGRLRQFDNVFSSCSQTQCGIGSILQSRPAHRVTPVNFSLPKLLKRQGYQLRYLLSADHQSFMNLKNYYGPDIDFYMDGRDMDPRHPTDDFVMLRHLDRLPASNEVTAPQFIMFGVMSVHVLGLRHEEFRIRKPDQIGAAGLAERRLSTALGWRNNYLNGVRQADFVLQGIWQWLERSGYLQQSIVIITADHGESLGEHGLLGHARSLSTPELHIPLWIHAPDTSSWPASPFAFQTDLAPTVLDWLGLPVPSNWEGQSLLRARDRGVQLPLFFLNRSDQFGLLFDRQGRLYKYLYDGAQHRASLFDLSANLTDADNLAVRQDKADLAGLQARLVQVFGPQMLELTGDVEK